MKVLLQRVKKASVVINNEIYSEISKGLLIFLGIEKNDAEKEADWLINKLHSLRIFEDENGKMNLSVLDIKGEILAVSQFTLAGDTSCGNRPGFETAEKPELAKPMYEYFVQCLRNFGIETKCGIFQADMKVSLINDGPVTFMLERK